MESKSFDSYMEWKKAVDEIGFSDIVLGVKDTIKSNTLYISLGNSHKVGADDFSWIIGYTYNLVASVEEANSTLIQKLSEVIDGGLSFVSYSDASQLYIFSGSVYLPVGEGGELWD